MFHPHVVDVLSIGGVLGTLWSFLALYPVVFGNSMQNSSLISKEFLRRLKNTLSFTMSVKRQYNDLYSSQGTKPGVTINLRKPPRFAGRRGQEAKPEAIVDSTVPLRLTTQYGQDVAISSQEEALNLQDYAEQVMQPALEVIANMVDADGLQLAYEQIPQYVGTPGTVPSTNLVYIQSGSRLSDEAVPTGKSRYCVVNPTMEGQILDTQATQSIRTRTSPSRTAQARWAARSGCTSRWTRTSTPIGSGRSVARRSSMAPARWARPS